VHQSLFHCSDKNAPKSTARPVRPPITRRPLGFSKISFADQQKIHVRYMEHQRSIPLGVLATGHVIEAAAADLAGASPGETGKLLAEAIRPASGGILMINAAHDWQRLPDHGLQVLRRLYEQLTEYRNERRDELAVILSGQAAPLRSLLHSNPSLAARFRAVIDFPGSTPGSWP
jgi:hypothetical protein